MLLNARRFTEFSFLISAVADPNIFLPWFVDVPYGDRETYAKYMSNFRTYAVITPDGKWYAEGNMGWFGCSSATPEEFKKWCEHYKEIFLDNADPKWILTIVDCHI